MNEEGRVFQRDGANLEKACSPYCLSWNLGSVQFLKISASAQSACHSVAAEKVWDVWRGQRINPFIDEEWGWFFVELVTNVMFPVQVSVILFKHSLMYFPGEGWIEMHCSNQDEKEQNIKLVLWLFWHQKVPFFFWHEFGNSTPCIHCWCATILMCWCGCATTAMCWCGLFSYLKASMMVSSCCRVRISSEGTTSRPLMSQVMVGEGCPLIWQVNSTGTPSMHSTFPNLVAKEGAVSPRSVSACRAVKGKEQKNRISHR